MIAESNADEIVDNYDDYDDDYDDDGDNQPVGVAGPVLGKGAVEAEVPVLPPVRVPHLIMMTTMMMAQS